ncbi:MAG: class I SAM-dependent RNA methyltransferase [Xanthobacteraceae bacterium]|nr:MAG: class I SAM-dependent RNA methyltransferase [Xanthobacteraceae bacterium]
MVDHLTIDHVAHRGDGAALHDGGTVFVPFTLPGEVVEAEAVAGHPDRRHLLRVEQPSPERIPAFCPHFGICGGCAIQHWQPERYRAWKRGLVVETLRQAGLEAEVGELLDAHGEGRRRIVVHARRGTHDILQVGYMAQNAHQIIPIDHCPILAPALGGALAAAWEIAEFVKPADKPLDIQITATFNGLDIDVRGSGPLPPSRMAELARLAERHRLARLTRHGELILLRAPPLVEMGPARVTLPPGAFLQATARGEQVLAERVLALTDGAKTVADLFCGVGPFALRLAQRARVVAYDSESGAIDALRKAAQATQGLKPVAAEARDLFRRPLMPTELSDIKAVVFDPPRQGAVAQARQLAQSRVPVIVAVSCNATTFARDARILIEGGYRLETVTPVDQFRHTPHAELVARLTRTR